MHPVAVFTHIASEGPGYLADFFSRAEIPWQHFPVDAGSPIPRSPDTFAGLVFMGGPMSVNDDIPWITEECCLIRAAMAAGRPVLGHCLGAQLMAKAMGGAITRNPCKELGWGEVQSADNLEARAWLGDEQQFPVFHWHGETFSLPEGATRILTGPHCLNQGFVQGSLHLGLQCHVEMNEAMIEAWCSLGAGEITMAPGPGVQSAEEILAATPEMLPRMRRVADRLYQRWTVGLPR